MKIKAREFYKEGNLSVEANIEYDPSCEIGYVKECLHESLGKVGGFFSSLEKRSLKIDIVLLYARDEYDAVAGFKSEKRNAGLSKGTRICIFHPDFFESQTIYPRAAFQKSLTHELSHVFIRELSADYLWWVTEGVAQYIAGQDEYKELAPQNIEHFLGHDLYENSNYQEFSAHQGHQISKRLAYGLVRRFQEDVLKKLLNVHQGRGAKDQLSAITGYPKEALESNLTNLLR